MTGSTRSMFGRPDDYELALREYGVLGFLITGRGAFRAQLIRISLTRMQLVAGEETLSRIAFIRPPGHLMRVSLPVRAGVSVSCGEVVLRPGEILTQGPGQRMHERTDGPSHWRTIWLPESELTRYGRAMIGAAFSLPHEACRWRPRPGALRCLTGLYDDAIRTNKADPRLAAETKAAYGLEQQLVEALVECLQGETPDEHAAARIPRSDIMGLFEDLLQGHLAWTLSISEMSVALGVPDRTLRACCMASLGMGPLQYLSMRRMQAAHRALRDADPAVARVSDIARRYGFDGLSRFTARYRQQFGELPSVTLRDAGG